MKISLKLTALALAMAGAVGTAQATALVIENPTANVDIVAGSFGGTMLVSAITNISNMYYNGTARAAVYDTGSGLDFYYQFTNNDSSQHGIERFAVADFSGLGTSAVSIFQTAAAFDMFVAGTAQSEYADRTSFGVMGMNFVPDGNSKVNPGTTSFTQIIRTSATTYAEGNFALLNGYGDNATGFAVGPDEFVTPVPEPETYAMLLAGLGIIGTIIRRRKAKQG